MKSLASGTEACIANETKIIPRSLTRCEGLYSLDQLTWNSREANKCQLRLKALLAWRRNNEKVIQVVNYIREAFTSHHTSNRTGSYQVKYTGFIFKTKTKKIVCKELVESVERPAEA